MYVWTGDAPEQHEPIEPVGFSTDPRPTSTGRYIPGDEVDGHLLTESGKWVRVYTTPPPKPEVKTTSDNRVVAWAKANRFQAVLMALGVITPLVFGIGAIHSATDDHGCTATINEMYGPASSDWQAEHDACVEFMKSTGN